MFSEKGEKNVLDGLRLGDMPLPPVKGLVVGKGARAFFIRSQMVELSA